MKIATLEMTLPRFMQNFHAMESARAGSLTPAGWYRALSASVADVLSDHVLLPKDPTDAAVEALCKVLDPEYGVKISTIYMDCTAIESDEEFAQRILSTRAKARRLYAALVV